MTVFRLYISAPSDEALRQAMEALPDLAVRAPETEWLGSWSGANGKYVEMSGTNSDTVSDLANLSGLGVSYVDRIGPVRPPHRFPEDDVWCPFHKRYHAPPAH